MISDATRNISISRPKWQILDATTIKLIAAVLMLFDHIHQMWAHADAPVWLNILGRPVFPLFLFLAAESFHYTRSKKTYLKRMLFASCGMTVFTFLLQWLVPNQNVVLMNNAFSTFFVTGLYMLSWDWFVEGVRNKAPKKVIKAVLFALVPVLCAIPSLVVGILASNGSLPAAAARILVMLSMLIPNLLTVEGSFQIVILGLLFYMFRKHRSAQIILLLSVSALLYVVNPAGNIQWLMCLAVVPMALYNGERGRGMKNFFYIFYPAHIGLLYLLSTFVG